MTMTRFLERKIQLFERRLLDLLTDEQGQLYLKNALTLADMSETEQAAFNAPSSVALGVTPFSDAALAAHRQKQSSPTIQSGAAT
jgi:hypothetical protein